MELVYFKVNQAKTVGNLISHSTQIMPLDLRLGSCVMFY